MVTAAVGGGSDPGPRPSHARYAAAILITVAAVLSQYVVPVVAPVTAAAYGYLWSGLLIVYGIPIGAFALLVGAAPLRGWATGPARASVEGLRWFGLFSLLAIGVLLAEVIVYAIVDPHALTFASRPNPVLEGARPDPWFWIGFSFVIGALEETIFRGWIFGYWVRSSTGPWIGAAIGSSLLFAGVHLYYGFTYLAAAPLFFPQLFLLGLSFAVARRYSNGNLIVISLLHGTNDAAAFLTLVNGEAALLLRYGPVLVGLVLALVVYLRESPATTVATTPPPPARPEDPYRYLESGRPWESLPPPPPGSAPAPPQPPGPPPPPPG